MITNTLLTAGVFTGVFIVPTILVVMLFLVTGRKIDWMALALASFTFVVYVVMLKSRHLIPVPDAVSHLSPLWLGKTMSLAGTITLLFLLPRVSFKAAGLTLSQRAGSLQPAFIAGAITLVSATATTFFLKYDPDTSTENLLFQATMPGLDEELYMRGLMLLLLHQAFGKGLQIFGVETGWGFWLVVVMFGLLHGFSTDSGQLQIHLGMIFATGFVGFILTWMRERTGSLLMPIAFHNLFNICQAFV